MATTSGLRGSSIDKGVEFLEHHGVLGMRWGVRKPRGSGPGPAGKAAAPKKSVSEDKKTVKALEKRSGKPASLSNDELQQIIKRLDLESKYNKTHPDVIKRGENKVKRVMELAATAGAVYAFSQSPLGKRIGASLAAQLGTASVGKHRAL